MGHLCCHVILCKVIASSTLFLYLGSSNFLGIYSSGLCQHIRKDPLIILSFQIILSFALLPLSIFES